MNEQPINPDDPAFLLSRRLDGDLTDDERRRLDNSLRSSESLRADAESMRRMTDLLGRWADAPVELDWEAHAALINARCRSDDASQDQPELDGILRRWSRGGVAVDEDQFTSGVMQRVGRGTSGIEARSIHRWIFRIAAPLAAAAVLVFALVGGPGMPDRPGPGIVENPSVETAPPGLNEFQAPICIVRFARVTPNDSVDVVPRTVNRPRGISFTAIGIATGSLGVSTSNPLGR